VLNNKNNILLQLRHLGLAGEEAKIYLALLEKPMSHLELARNTGVNRTKVYRLADNLIARSLITYEQGDEGRFLAAADPSNLEVALVTEEENLKAKRQLLKTALPFLQQAYRRNTASQPNAFTVNTYEGVAGFKQMLWNELQTKDELLAFGNGTLQDLVGSSRWAEKQRAMVVSKDYKIRELLNPGTKPAGFTANQDFLKHISERFISPHVLPLDQQICIYNDTVNTYHWRDGKKVGYEVISQSHANMMRQIFEHYWALASKIE
jgi:sugar-specific transcriptional regulator TrmB